MANTVSNVTAGKPKISGSIFRAALPATLPTDATTALDAGFKLMGYISEDGVVNSNTPETTDIKAWGGDTVLNIQESKDDTFQFTMLEVLNTDVLKAVYGSANVSGALGMVRADDFKARKDDEENNTLQKAAYPLQVVNK